MQSFAHLKALLNTPYQYQPIQNLTSYLTQLDQHKEYEKHSFFADLYAHAQKNKQAKIIVTGAAGFVGSNLIEQLNQFGYTNIIAVDHFSKADKFKNLIGLQFAEFIDKHAFLQQFSAGLHDDALVLFHQGACSDTTEQNAIYMMDNNYEYSKVLFKQTLKTNMPFIYASSAAVYGNTTEFVEQTDYEKPLNIYGYSKLAFDNYVRKHYTNNQVVAGLRYFNVYGAREQHKARMASVAFHHMQQFKQTGKVRLFGAYDGYLAGQQHRDFVYVKDVVNVNCFFLQQALKQVQQLNIVNVGCGKAQPFNAIAYQVIAFMLTKQNQQNQQNQTINTEEILKHIEYIEFPNDLKGKYQSYTQANTNALKQAGYNLDFYSIEEGVLDYCAYLHAV